MQTKAVWIAAGLALLGTWVPVGGPAVAVAAASEAPAPAPAPADQIDTSSPYDLVKSAASTLLQNLDAHRNDYQHDPAKLRSLVDQVLLPHFDSEFAARLVLGRNWLTATPQQRQRFISAFYNSLLNNYGNALLDFTSNTMQVLPYRPQPGSSYAVVSTRIRRGNGSNVAVNYQLRSTPQGWKVWDVVVEGISYDKSFQQDFAEQIQHQGLEAVIARLEHGDTPAAIKQTTGS